MYVPAAFRIDEVQALGLLQRIGAAQLVTATADGPMATMMPWVFDADSGRLVGHMARGNAQWRTEWIGPAMVLALGPDGYVTPSWYASKAEHGKVVPTWDYVAVQVQGPLTVHDDQAWVEAAVRRLTDRFESERPEPWSVDDAPSDYIGSQLRGIVGMEVRVDRIQAAVKMSQNRSEADILGVVDGFMNQGSVELAEWVRGSRGA